ncbi:MAG: hypothetical protein R3F42_04900 [Pseudomonadota bacterium]
MTTTIQGRVATRDNTAKRAAGKQRNTERDARLRSLLGDRWHTLMYYVLVIAVIAYGWLRRGDVYLSPEDGVGYALGIIGGSLMVLLLLYPLRKHVSWMRRVGKVKHWFRMHMIIGVLAPVLILYHCNFQLGSMNGTIALFSMLLVASSGLLGRYFYTRIHYGLYGRKADLERLNSDAIVIKAYMHRVFAADPGLQDRLTILEQKTLRQPHSLVGGIWHIAHISVLSRWYALLARMRLRNAQNAIILRDRLNPEEIRRLRISSSYYLRLYMESIRRVAGFTFFERLFGFWHVLHLPLFLMMLVAGVIHVYAVHFY